MANASKLTLLTLPIEIRSIVYDLLLCPGLAVWVVAAAEAHDSSSDSEYDPTGRKGSTTWRADAESWAIETVPPLSNAQLLRVCRQVYDECRPILYNRTFDLTAREAPQLLLHNIGSGRFRQIKHIVIGWDTFEEFSRLLNKNEFLEGTAGVEVLELVYWRIRHVGGSALNYRHIQRQERSVLEAARNVLSKHAALKYVAERIFVRSSDGTTAMDATFRKVKWRILADESMLMEDEMVLDLEHELDRINVAQSELETVSMPMIDPF